MLFKNLPGSGSDDKVHQFALPEEEQEGQFGDPEFPGDLFVGINIQAAKVNATFVFGSQVLHHGGP